MRLVLVSSTLAFCAGVGVGGLAFGQRDASSHTPVTTNTNARSINAPPSTSDEQPSRDTPDNGQPQTAANVEEAIDVAEIAIEPMSPAAQMLVLQARWAELEGRFDRLSRRVVDLEQQLFESTDATSDGGDESMQQPLPIVTPEDRRIALETVGVDRQVAEDILWRESTLAMARLDLQDLATREGWMGSDRYFEELGALNEQAVDLRAEVGDIAYDHFLFETGQPNRVTVSSVIPGSQGEQAGILPGDIIEDYAGDPVFTFGDLRSATTAGAREETVPVTVRRGDRVIETWMARGPIGVRVEADSADPDR